MLGERNSLAEHMQRELLQTATSYNEKFLRPFCLRLNVSGFTPKSGGKVEKKVKKKVGKKVEKKVEKKVGKKT